MTNRLRHVVAAKMIQTRRAFWNGSVNQQRSIIGTIQPFVRMRLYGDCKLSPLIYAGAFEQAERRFLNCFLRPGDVFFDVGANIGLFSLIAAYKVGPTGRVHAFEPCSKTYERLVDNVSLNGCSNVSCHQLALSDTTASLKLKISLDGYDAWNSFGKPIEGKAFDTEVVHAISLDDFLSTQSQIRCITLMKIDVEGWETHVLAGARSYLARNEAPVLLVEFTERAARSAGTSTTDLYHSLEALGYRMFWYDPQTRTLVPDPIRESYPYINLIATKEPELITARLRSASWFADRGDWIHLLSLCRPATLFQKGK